jgi:hypothetical protein
VFIFSASGFLCFGPSFFATAALILSIFANSRCYLLSIDKESRLRDEIFPPPQSIGLWCYQGVNGSYYDLRGFNFDSKFEAARGLGTTVMALGWIIWIFYLLSSCFRCGPTIFKVCGFFGVLNCLFQSLVFLLKKSGDVCNGDDLGCGLDTGGRCAIAAAVLWFFTGIFSCGAGKEAEEEVLEQREEREQGNE